MALSKPKAPNKDQSLAGAIEAYLDYLAMERGLVENTLFHYGHDMTLYRRFMERVMKRKASEIPVDAVTSRTIEAFLDDQTYRRKNSTSSTRRRLACLRGFTKFLSARRIVPHAGHPELELPRDQTLPPTYLRSDEQIAFLDAARTAAPDPERDYAIFVLFLRCGCRLSEVLRLTIDDVDLRSGHLHIRHTDETERVLPLPLEAHRALAAYMARRPKSLLPYLFLNRNHQPITKGAVYYAFNRCLSAAGIRRTRITVHTLRNTYIKSLIERNYPRTLVQELAGTRSSAALNPHYKERQQRRARSSPDSAAN